MAMSGAPDTFGEEENFVGRRYPLHDCCEFEDAESLRALVFIEGEEEDDDDANAAISNRDADDSSTSEDNDSTAAAQAAAIGHSPKPVKVPYQVQEIPDSLKHPLASGDTRDKPHGLQPKLESMQKIESSEGPEESTTTSNNGTLIVNKVSSKDLPSRKRLLPNPDVYLNERDEDENTPLHIAIHGSKLEHARILMEAGASLRTRCDGSLPIHTAISMGSMRSQTQFAYECVVLLKEHGADLSSKDESNHTPLFLACMFNLPQVAEFILSDEEGLATLNCRADRNGNRPLQAAAKFDTPENTNFTKRAASIATGQTDLLLPPSQIPHVQQSKEKGTPLQGNKTQTQSRTPSSVATATTEALLTQILLASSGIEIDAANFHGQTPLHVACMRRNWPVARLLLQAGANTKLMDKRGYTPGGLAYKRAAPIPNDLVAVLGEPPEKGVIPPRRELIVDPDGSTVIICHDVCTKHNTCPPIRRDSPEPPPENVRRLHVLLDQETGILRTGEFSGVVWVNEARRAAIGDVLKVHEYNYVEKVSTIASSIPDHPNAIAHLDGDTAVSQWSFEAAMRAAGSVCEAVDRVVAGEKIRNAFCAVRPPGHHAGPRGIVHCANDPEGGSHGFCLLNNVCVGAAYARSMYRNEGIQKVAIIDFDVHHGNGTEAIIQNLIPSLEKGSVRTPFAVGEISTSVYRPWLDETDIQNVFFSSTHGFGNRGYDQPGWFYPASGKTHTSESISHPSMVESPTLSDFLASQSWTRMSEEARADCCKIINVGFDLPAEEGDQVARGMRQRLEVRDAYRKKILPALRDFDPDIIFISAGFDAHRRDTMNFGYVGMVEDDYEWLTEQLVKISNTCCNGRVVSVLEGGYKIHGGIVSPFARSVASHVRALVEGSKSRELYDPDDVAWESAHEHQIYERRERKKQQEREQIKQLQEIQRKVTAGEGDPPDDPDAPSRKRRRNNVNYKELFKQMQEEGFAG